MTEVHRDRASGWSHAKRSGHSNEARVKALLDTDPVYREHFMQRIGYGHDTVYSTSIGGLHETNVPGVMGKKTKSKTDLKIYCTSGRCINVSIKKSLTGQVYLVRAELFMQVFEAQFKKAIPPDVRRAICLFWAAVADAVPIIKDCGDRGDAKSFLLQLRHKSLNAATLRFYDKHLYDALRNWFVENMYELTMLSFAMGAAADQEEWSEFVWYINLLGEHPVDAVFNIEQICRGAAALADRETYYGDKNGGTTIQLPFGFVQWHQAQLQFRHDYHRLCGLAGRV